MLPKLKAFDVVIIDGLWYIPHHWPIRWRGFDNGVHAVTVRNEHGDIWNPVFTGIKEDNIKSYKGRKITIHRYKGELNMSKLLLLAQVVTSTSQGYDFIRQWLFGFVLGLSSKTLVNDEHRWTCAEFPYWLFTYTGHKLTAKEETLPMPRLFRYNDHFECIFDGTYV